MGELAGRLGVWLNNRKSELVSKQVRYQLSLRERLVRPVRERVVQDFQIPPAIFIGESLASQGLAEDNRVIGCQPVLSIFTQSYYISFGVGLHAEIHLPN